MPGVYRTGVGGWSTICARANVRRNTRGDSFVSLGPAFCLIFKNSIAHNGLDGRGVSDPGARAAADDACGGG